jgi:hypothetical protein
LEKLMFDVRARSAFVGGAAAIIVSGCVSVITDNKKTTWKQIDSQLFGVDYGAGPTAAVEADIVRLGLEKKAFVARYVVSESDNTAWKLFAPAKERSFIGNAPILLVAVPRAGVDHSEEVGRIDGDKTAQAVAALLKQHESLFDVRSQAIAVTLNVEGLGQRQGVETELSTDYYRGWASQLIAKGKEHKLDLRPALYMSLRADRAAKSWHRVAEVENATKELGPVAIWAHDPAKSSAACERRQLWSIADRTIMPKSADLEERIFAVQYVVDCACDRRWSWRHFSLICSGGGYDLSIVRSQAALARLEPFLLRYRTEQR